MEVVDWGNLEALPLSLIFDKLVERIDHIYFSVVCKNWYSIAKFSYQNRQIKNNVLPMLMIPTKRRCRTKRCLYGISSNTIYQFQLPLPYNKRLCGSSHGWVAKVDFISNLTIITLLNPFKNLVSIPLPPIYMPDIYIEELDIMNVTFIGLFYRQILQLGLTIMLWLQFMVCVLLS